MDWLIYGILGAGSAALAGTSMLRRTRQDAFAAASELESVGDLGHLPEALQRTALWSLSEGGFERRVVHGVVKRAAAPVPGDVAVTAFDLETLRSRRGEWAYLPVEPPFRIGDVVSVVVCELDRTFPHLLLKRTGRGDKVHDDSLGEISTSLTRVAREALRTARNYPADLPPGLAPEPLELASPALPGGAAAPNGAAVSIELPEHWRAYGREVEPLLRHAEFRGALARTHRRDLVVELIDSLLVVYPAARAIAGADPFADLVSSALALVDAIRASVVSPRGVENH